MIPFKKKAKAAFFFWNHALWLRFTRNSVLETPFLDYKLYIVPDESDQLVGLEGDNGKQIFIAVGEDHWDGWESFLNKIFKAAGVVIGHDTLLWKEGAGTPLPSLSQVSNRALIRYVFLFGVSARALGIQVDLPVNVPFEWNGHVFFISKPLREVDQSGELKRPLWEFLKKAFLSPKS